MGFGVFGSLTEPRMRHPRGNLIGDPVLSDMDFRQVTSGMTVKKTMVSASTKPASSNAGVRHNIHVFPSWMMVKAMWHMDVPSLLLRRRYFAE
jgi:hypothetical protein